MATWKLTPHLKTHIPRVEWVTRLQNNRVTLAEAVIHCWCCKVICGGTFSKPNIPPWYMEDMVKYVHFGTDKMMCATRA